VLMLRDSLLWVVAHGCRANAQSRPIPQFPSTFFVI
jgi:hypothetical protein